jgi:hypothetical protein
MDRGHASAMGVSPPRPTRMFHSGHEHYSDHRRTSSRGFSPFGLARSPARALGRSCWPEGLGCFLFEIGRASRSLTVLSLPMLSRVLTALAGAVIGSGLALLDAKYLAQTGYAPQTMGGWFAFYVGLCLPWALLGAVVGFVVSKRGEPNH